MLARDEAVVWPHRFRRMHRRYACSARGLLHTHIDTNRWRACMIGGVECTQIDAHHYPTSRTCTITMAAPDAAKQRHAAWPTRVTQASPAMPMLFLCLRTVCCCIAYPLAKSGRWFGPCTHT
eukprot:6174660-Pleurochrysis_carterae.AAC.6